MIGFVVFSLRRAWQGFWRNALMSLAATATMVLMLLLLAGFWILQTGLQAGLDYVEEGRGRRRPQGRTSKQSEVDPVLARLHAMPQVSRSSYVTKDAALARWRQHLKEQGEDDLTRYLDRNPLPASLEVKLVDASVFEAVVDLAPQRAAGRRERSRIRSSSPTRS